MELPSAITKRKSVVAMDDYFTRSLLDPIYILNEISYRKLIINVEFPEST